MKATRAAALGREEDDSIMMTEVSEDGENLVYKRQLSSATCDVDEI